MGLKNISLTGFMISLVLVSLFAGIFGLFISNSVTVYGTGDNSYENLSFYDKTAELNSKIYEIKGNTTSVGLSSNPLDVFVGFAYNSYKVLITIPQSFSILESMGEQGLNDMHLGAGGELIKNALMAIVVILLFIGVILASLIKSDRI